jgi:hypothetical protein
MAKKESKDYLTQEDGQIIITLARAETVNGEKVEAVTMREPTVGDMKRTEAKTGSDADKVIFATANLLGITPGEVQQFSMRNFNRVQEAYALFTD